MSNGPTIGPTYNRRLIIHCGVPDDWHKRSGRTSNPFIEQRRAYPRGTINQREQNNLQFRCKRSPLPPPLDQRPRSPPAGQKAGTSSRSGAWHHCADAGLREPEGDLKRGDGYPLSRSESDQHAQQDCANSDDPRYRMPTIRVSPGCDFLFSPHLLQALLCRVFHIPLHSLREDCFRQRRQLRTPFCRSFSGSA